MRKEFNSQRIFWVHQHGRRFIVLEHQYGRRDIMWKRSILSWKWYISRTISKTAQNIKYNRLLLREVTPTENKHKNDNWFREQFLQNLSSQNTRNDVSEHQDFKIFLGSMPPDPPSGWPLQHLPDLSVIKKGPHDFLYLKSWTVFLWQHDTLSVQLL